MFSLIENKKIALLGVNAMVFENKKFSCQHIHLDCESPEKAFVVAFRTIPNDSTGVAHILEHTVLCGSKKYPVRDPFFMMTRRSLSTFMNAMTYPDITAYPFATLNDKDFENLLSVYLDAAFFPNLDELDFMQEGHRVELIGSKKENEALALKGVVYNEMKGAMSSVPRKLWHGLSEALYPETTYGFNSGGDPDVIPNLTYKDLIDFHKKYYHPSNSCFFSYGKLDVESLQRTIQNEVLDRFIPQKEKLRVTPEPYFVSPRYSKGFYNPLPDDKENHHVVTGWLLPSSKDPVDHLEASLLENILLDNSSSLLRKTLENSELGKAPSPITGMETEQKQMAFFAGLEGVKADNEKEVESLILKVFDELVKQGIHKEQIEASLHQIEISQREISGGMPYGLQLLLGTMPSTLHDSKALEVLDLEGSLNQLKDRLKQPRHLENLIEHYFLENKHRVTFQLIPDESFDSNKTKSTEEFLIKKLRSLSEEDKSNVKSLTEKLDARQNSVDNPDLLPCVSVSDVSKDRFYTSGIKIEEREKIKYLYQAGTNGIDYTSEVFPMHKVSYDDLKFSNLFSDIVTNVGINGKPYEEIQHRQSLTTGGIGFSFYILPCQKSGDFRISGGLHGNSLQQNFDKLKNLMEETINEFRLDELKRIEELTEFDIAGREKSITQSGHILAMSSASSQLSLFGAVSEFVGGISSIHNLKSVRNSKGAINLELLLDSFQRLKGKLSVDPSLEVVISAKEIEGAKDNTDKTGLERLAFLSGMKLQEKEYAWITASDVSFCSQAFPTVDYSHADAPVLSVLGAVLRNGFLHSAIREKGGAYGSGAQQDSATKTFRFFSYRDPNCRKTFDAFNESINWSLQSITKEKLDEGILGVVSSIDKPGSPAGEARSDFNQNIKGINKELRHSFRQGVIECTVEKLKYATDKYLSGVPKRAVISGKKFEEELQSLGFELKNV